MPEDHQKDTSQPNPSSHHGRLGERVIQPMSASAQTDESPEPPKPKIDTSTIYPEATKTIGSHNAANANQMSAQKMMEFRTNQADRAVSLRVKSVMAIGILSLIGALYTMFWSFNLPSDSGFGFIMLIVGFIQALMSGYLLIGKDHNTISTILTVYIVFQVISLVGSLLNPINFISTGIILVVMIYARGRVNNLSYY